MTKRSATVVPTRVGVDRATWSSSGVLLRVVPTRVGVDRERLLSCYTLGAVRTGGLLGHTDTLCILPGFTNLGP